MHQTTDFLSSSYVAGSIVLKGEFHSLYPSAKSYDAFAVISRSLLPQLPSHLVPNWQYPPPAALAYSIFALCSPLAALVIWQSVNYLCLYLSCLAFSRIFATIRPWQIFLLSCTFFPIAYMLKTGSAGIVFGLFPIALALWQNAQARPFIAGLCLSLCLLTVKYLPVALFLGTLLAIIQYRQLAAGLAAGLLCLAAAPLLLMAPYTWTDWLQSMAAAEHYYSFDSDIQHNMYLHVALPAILLSLFSAKSASPIKLIIYGIAAIVALHAFYLGTRVGRANLPLQTKLAIFVILGFYLMPLVEPHLVFYDLAGLFFANLLLWLIEWPEDIAPKMKGIALTSWLAVDVYFIAFAFLSSSSINPAFLTALLGILYIQLLLQFRKLIAAGKQKNGRPVHTTPLD